ncbi:hypothetical protein I6E29_08465 [Arcanobacterium haemolyticum]|nr:hypothetical protein [Arcanobacterium haemolyticum]
MKKVVAVVVIVAAACAVAACSKGSDVQRDEPSTPASSTIEQHGSTTTPTSTGEGSGTPRPADHPTEPSSAPSIIPPRDFTTVPDPGTPRIPEDPTRATK